MKLYFFNSGFSVFFFLIFEEFCKVLYSRKFILYLFLFAFPLDFGDKEEEFLLFCELVFNLFFFFF